MRELPQRADARALSAGDALSLLGRGLGYFSQSARLVYSLDALAWICLFHRIAHFFCKSKGSSAQVGRFFWLLFWGKRNKMREKRDGI